MDCAKDLNSPVITPHIPFSQTMIDKFSKFIIMLESWIIKQLRKNVEKNKRMPPEENVFTTTVAHKLDLFIFSPNKSLMKLDGVRSISSHEDITWVFWHLTPLHATSVFVWFECLRNPYFNFFCWIFVDRGKLHLLLTSAEACWCYLVSAATYNCISFHM